MSERIHDLLSISKARTVITLLFLLLYLSFPSSAEVQAGDDLQAAIRGAAPGETVLVGPGAYGPVVVDKPLVLIGVGEPVISADIQVPAIAIMADGVVVSGFTIIGVPEDTTAKFNRFMAGRSGSFQVAPLELDLPNAALLVEGDCFLLNDTNVIEAEVGIFLREVSSITLKNSSFDRCDTSVSMNGCSDCLLERCSWSDCSKGLTALESINLTLRSCRALNNTHYGVLLRDSSHCLAEDTTIFGSMEGLALWDTAYCEVLGNRIGGNYYGLLVSGSDNNTIQGNLLKENNRGDLGIRFGVGISLEENSSYNLVADNRISKSFNGLELIDGCERNALIGNYITLNTHGIRVKMNMNNLFSQNNLVNNLISIEDNQSHNSWNGTVGNYYSDYSGTDGDGDDIGDAPYHIPMGNSDGVDYRPLMKPAAGSPEMDIDRAMAEVDRYVCYDPVEDQTVRVEGGALVISAKRPQGPPRFDDTPGNKEAF